METLETAGDHENEWISPPRQPFDFYRSAMRGYSSAIPVMCGLLSGATYFEGPEHLVARARPNELEVLGAASVQRAERPGVELPTGGRSSGAVSDKASRK